MRNVWLHIKNQTLIMSCNFLSPSQKPHNEFHAATKSKQKSFIQSDRRTVQKSSKTRRLSLKHRSQDWANRCVIVSQTALEANQSDPVNETMKLKRCRPTQANTHLTALDERQEMVGGAGVGLGKQARGQTTETPKYASAIVFPTRRNKYGEIPGKNTKLSDVHMQVFSFKKWVFFCAKAVPLWVWVPREPAQNKQSLRHNRKSIHQSFRV